MRRDGAHTSDDGRADVDERQVASVGDHDAPESWLDRWRDREPIRLYLWSVASAVLAGCVVAGWLTRELALAIAGPVSAALMVGGTAAARGQAYAPATVDRLQAGWEQRTDSLLDDEYDVAFGDGWDAGVAAAEKAAAEIERTPEKVAAETRGHAAPGTVAMSAAEPCGYVQRRNGVELRCVLSSHPDAFPHRLEGVGAQE
jgi:hypothetical protein